jgi:ResB-like family
MSYSSPVKSLFSLARSPRVAVALLLLGVASSVLSTFVRSPFFFIPVVLFAISLGACGVHRVAARLRAGAKPRFGPDLIHLGLLVLICGGLLSALGRQEKLLSMAAGDQAQIDPSRTLRVLSLGVQRYADGSPREWVSTVAVLRNGSPEIAPFPIRVNAPLRLRGVSIYQATWTTEGVLDLKGAGGEHLSATTGQGFRHGDTLWYFARVQPEAAGLSAIFEQWKGNEKTGERSVSSGGSIGPFTVVGVSSHDVTGLRVVRDPGFPLVIAALVAIGMGLALAFFQRKKDIPA